MSEKTDWLKIAAMIGTGAAVCYVIREARGGSKASLFGANVKINPEKVVDSAMPWMGLENPIHREMVRAGLKGVLGKKKG